MARPTVLHGIAGSPALLRRRSACRFETPTPTVLATLLQAQGWEEARPQPTMRFFRKDGETIGIADDGLVIATSEDAQLFLSSLVAWSGGALW